MFHLLIGGLFLWGQTKRAGDANMYPKPVQDFHGWDVRDVACANSSLVVVAEDTLVTWGPSPTFGELVRIIPQFLSHEN